MSSNLCTKSDEVRVAFFATREHSETLARARSAHYGL